MRPLKTGSIPNTFTFCSTVLIKTKKYKLEPALYIKTAMLELLKKQWWFIAGPIAVACLAFISTSWWFVSIAILIVVLYIFFWAVQFADVTQLEQNKMLFQKMSYEIDGRQILMKINEREGMPVKWEMIKAAKKTKEHYLLALSKAQFIFVPYNIFVNQNDLRMMASYLKRKNLIADAPVKTTVG